jgi:uncharacterized membrane protein YjjP (DUF1212 family)
MGDEIMPFSWPYWFAGVFVGVAAGGILCLIGGLATQNVWVAVLCGAAPGVLLSLLSRRATQNGLGQGLLTGACLIVVVGGVCGGLVGGS